MTLYRIALIVASHSHVARLFEKGLFDGQETGVYTQYRNRVHASDADTKSRPDSAGLVGAAGRGLRRVVS
ncbi:acetyl-CoA acetyltransferase / 3-ketoacyl-CoA thiolase [Burkholderiales bacterium GJ-E10]|nr:acetyl-CoA acetyltransferase / 3-ketoacyl-CoA thiolase [Burkholderiales bacterium GJ-E10]